LPIIPLTLVNGAEGIGTGWSTFIPQHNPRDVVKNIKRIMNKEPYQQMHPWYKGYSGEIVEIDGKHIVTGKYEVTDDDTLEITELPIGKWTRDYKNFLEELIQKEEIEDIREYHQENRVHFVLTVPKLLQIERSPGIVKFFKLQTSLSASN
jgi:DNA topoisomerase-2